MVPLIATAITIVTLALIFSGKLNHTIAAMTGAVVMMGTGMAMGFYTEAQAIEAIEFDALGLLLGMMILVSILEPT